MGSNFSHLKKRARRVALLASVLFGIGIGGLTLAGIILAAKITASPIEIYYYVIGLGTAVLSAAAAALFLIPSDKRLARRIDTEHKLHEKVGTMVEFAHSDDEFAVLQRENADEHLGKIKFKPWRRKQWISMLVVLTLAAASLTTAFAIPSQAFEEPEIPLGEFDKEFLLAGISNIITTVEASLIADSLKAKELENLRALHAFCSDSDYFSEMKLEAAKSVIALDSLLKAENTASSMGAAISACANPTLKALGTELVKLNGTAVQKAIGTLQTDIESGGRDKAAVIADELSAAISSSGADAAQPLTVLLQNLAAAINGYSNGGISSPSEAFGTVKTSAMTETMVQSLNSIVTQTAIADLCKLFQVTQDDLSSAGAKEEIKTEPPEKKPTVDDTEEEESKKDNDEQQGPGGIGTGDRIYGSNDVIYNPYTNTYVAYGEVLDEYAAAVLQMKLDGRIPPDLEAFTDEYFQSLADSREAEAEN